MQNNKTLNDERIQYIQNINTIILRKLQKWTKPFCFSEWYRIRVCLPQSCYELSITWRWQQAVKQLSGWEIMLKNLLSASVRRCLS